MLIGGTDGSWNQFPQFSAHGAVFGWGHVVFASFYPTPLFHIRAVSIKDGDQVSLHSVCQSSDYDKETLYIKKRHVLLFLIRFDTDLTGTAIENEGCTEKDLDISYKFTGPL